MGMKQAHAKSSLGTLRRGLSRLTMDGQLNVKEKMAPACNCYLMLRLSLVFLSRLYCRSLLGAELAQKQ